MISELGKTAIAAGTGLALFFAPAAISPEVARRLARRLPRNAPLGWLLCGAGIFWSAHILWNAVFLADIPWARKAIAVGMPVSFAAVVLFLDELLAARAFGGILLLVPRPILDAAFLSDHPLKLVMTVFAYALVIAGIALVLSPYLFRTTVERVLGSDLSARCMGGAGVFLGAVFLWLGFLVY